VNVKQRNWSKVTEKFVLEKGNNIDWSVNVESSVNEMWEDINSKLQTIISDIPETVLKVSRHGELLEKAPWESSRLGRKRKEKDQTWRVFEGTPCMENFQTAMGKQREYEKVEYEEKLKHEQKIVNNLKTNCKPLFRYFKSKAKTRKNVSSLKTASGKLTESPIETAEDPRS
jgi:hypothetical protein